MIMNGTSRYISSKNAPLKQAATIVHHAVIDSTRNSSDEPLRCFLDFDLQTKYHWYENISVNIRSIDVIAMVDAISKVMSSMAMTGINVSKIEPMEVVG